MDVANASIYDGGSAAGRGGADGAGVTGRDRAWSLADGVHPDIARCSRPTSTALGLSCARSPSPDGRVDRDARRRRWIDDKTAGVVVQSPNFFGCLEDVEAVAELAHAAGALLVVVSRPDQPGPAEAPGGYGADIVVGEGQALGNRRCRSAGRTWASSPAANEFVRKMPGRLVGADHRLARQPLLGADAADPRAAHPPREGDVATSAPTRGCCALRATIYLAAMGQHGLARGRRAVDCARPTTRPNS